MSDLRAKVEGLPVLGGTDRVPTPVEQAEGWIIRKVDVIERAAVLALIPEGAVLVTPSDDRAALWVKWSGGERLAYGCGLRDGKAIPEGDGVWVTEETLAPLLDWWNEQGWREHTDRELWPDGGPGREDDGHAEHRLEAAAIIAKLREGTE
jgi:hypothetical protein